MGISDRTHNYQTTRISIPWPEILSPYPGKTIGERIRTAKAGRVFRELASELGVNVETAKGFYYRSGVTGERIRRDHVCGVKTRPNYREIMEGLIQGWAKETSLTPNQIREWITTQTGGKEFQRRCFERRIPVFTCHYQEKRGNHDHGT